MKKLLSVGLVLVPTLLWAQSGNYTIKGKLGTVNAPAKAYLRYMDGTTTKIDSASIQNGQFEFKGTVDGSARAMLLVDKRGTGMSNTRPVPAMSLYLEPGAIVINSPDSLLHAVVSGTKLNADNEKLKMALKSSSERMDKLMQEYQTATPAQRQASGFDASIEKRYEEISAEQKKLRGDFIKNNPKSLVSLDALKAYGGSVPEYSEVNPLFEGLSSEIKESKAGKTYGAALATLQKTAIGAVAPDFTQADTAGRNVSLHDFKGKYVLVDFWASWCGPCRKENPNVVKNFHQFKGQNFTVLGVSLDRPNAKEAWMNAIHKDGLTWTQVSDLKFWQNDVAKLYGVQAIPQNFLVGPDGKIIAKNIRGEDLGKKLAELLPVRP
ncbi:TlpA disulfide reductase family protein [Tellurirhabdus bombi]|uniref:TlpA disulfide reductase family protein n=1 Tax=Tellurirhabdus bombi TaxID=2907205 RepID=UPI001F43B764|nr:TlpA disulfide reductase family protein [Tellurirhabdus bombi]